MLDFLLKWLKEAACKEEYDWWWRTDGEYAPVTIFINCNDLFWWATADCERLTPENIDQWVKACDDCEAAKEHCTGYGQLLFCCRIRGMRPQGPYYKHLPVELWPLFDACGPIREGLDHAHAES